MKTPVKLSIRLSFALVLLLMFGAVSLAQESDDASSDEADDGTLTLEKLFPEKGLFGPGARSMAISQDGRYGAYLWRPYLERRHGSDLYLYDFETGEATRITKVSVMAEFQESTRKVKEDRIEKAKKNKQKAEKQKTENGEEGDGDDADADEDAEDEVGDEGGDEGGDGQGDVELGDVVDEKDADDEKAPRYSGIQSYTWSPEANEMIFTSQGDLYQLDAATAEITRLTRTAENERAVQYLPDGSGYTYLRDGALMCVRYGSHLVDQLDPKLPDGESMQSYEISPDGNRIVLLTGKGSPGILASRDTVTIVNYRDRFAKAREVPRTVPSSKMPDFEWGVYLYDMARHMSEDGALKKVYTKKRSGPRDIFRVPQWAPDSSKVAFAVFDQETELVSIYEAGFEDKPEEDEADEGDAEDDDAEADDEPQDEEGDDEEAEDEDPFVIEDATVVYKFLHAGGPNTPSLIRPYYLPDSHRMAFITELSGFRHLHVLDPLYEALDPLTSGRYEVYPEDISEDHTTMFIRSNKEDISQNDYYAVNLESGEMTRLTEGGGVYSGAAVSDDGRHVLASYVDFGETRELYAIDRAADEPQKVITDSHPEKVKPIIEAIPEYFTFENRHGHTIHGHMFKPADWSEDDQRPLLIYVYGGPLGSNRNQLARGSYSGSSYLFARYMTEVHGYVTCTIDPRGVSGYGALFEKSNFEQVGKPQVEDIVDCGTWMIENQGVDPDRIGMHGWSFGGFQTQMCLYTEPDFFACGIAGAGPTEWFNYNAWYTTGTIGTRDSVTGEKAAESDKYSLLPIAKNLKAKLLLIHGMEDSNVLYQDTVRVYRELLKAHKETLVELFLDPTGGHGLGGDVKSLGRYRKYEEFLVRCLGTEKVEEAEEENTE